MSLKILKPGILDTIQDEGRYGNQHLGINPGGVMDKRAMHTANFLVGNSCKEAVLEMFFPAPDILFECNALITITGANFSPMINGDGIKINRPVLVKKNTVIQFPQKKKGQCCYLAVQGGFKIEPWLGSCSTHLKAASGGFEGRRLRRNDVIGFKSFFENKELDRNDYIKLKWRAMPYDDSSAADEIYFLRGNEWDYLDDISKQNFLSKDFTVANASDRMGYRLNGTLLNSMNNTELVSSAVNPGTIQLLPDGGLIALMADSQTTGGYPRIAHIISAHLSKLAQTTPGDKVKFREVNTAMAEKMLIEQSRHLQQLKNACTFRLQEILK